MAVSTNPFTSRNWNTLLSDDEEHTNTFSSKDIESLKQKVAFAESHEDLSVKASQLVSDIVKFQDKKIILIGESSHGTAEFYETRADITRRLIEDKKCYVILLEADLPPCVVLHRYVMGENDLSIKQAMLPFTHRFPSWMWANQEFQNFVMWLRNYNMNQIEEERVAIFGMDLYSLQTSIKDVISFVRKHDAKCADLVEDAYGCFDGGKLDPQTYGLLVEKGLHEGCAKAAAKACVAIEGDDTIQVQPESSFKEIDENFINTMNANIVQGAEEYYRSMFDPKLISWNVRDQHFMDQTNRVIDHMTETRGEHYGRAVIWAHNSHVGNSHFSHLEKKQNIMKDQKRYQRGGGGGEEEHEFNIGQLTKETYPETSLLVGQFTYSGTVACADDWGGVQRVKPVRPGLLNSTEDMLHTVSGQKGHLIIDLTEPETRNLPALKSHRLQRAIGVIYRPDTERWSHYYTCDLAHQFDVVLWHDETSAVFPLAL